MLANSLFPVHQTQGKYILKDGMAYISVEQEIPDCHISALPEYVIKCRVCLS